MNATAALPVVGVDLAKIVFQLAVADGAWRVVEQQRLTRTQFERWFVNRAVGLVVMEACGSAHHWARWLNGLGIEVRLLPAAYIRAYVKRNKTDAADACALLEAARCADIAPVRVKSVEQQALQAMHRTRSLWMATRTSRINALRGFCREFGIVIAQGSRLGVEQIGRVLADPHSAVPLLIRGTMTLAGRGDPPARSAHRAARTRVDRAGPPIARLHHAAVDSRRRLADRHGDGGSDLRRGQPLPRCAALRLLVRPHAEGTFVRRHPPSRTHLQARRPLPAHAAHPRRALGVARGRRGACAPARPSMACGNGRWPCRPARITTRPPARWPTSWPASATRRCAMANRTGTLRVCRRRSRARRSRCQPEQTVQPVFTSPRALRRD